MTRRRRRASRTRRKQDVRVGLGTIGAVLLCSSARGAGVVAVTSACNLYDPISGLGLGVGASERMIARVSCSGPNLILRARQISHYPHETRGAVCSWISSSAHQHGRPKRRKKKEKRILLYRVRTACDVRSLFLAGSSAVGGVVCGRSCSSIASGHVVPVGLCRLDTEAVAHVRVGCSKVG